MTASSADPSMNDTLKIIVPVTEASVSPGSAVGRNKLDLSEQQILGYVGLKKGES
jgi:hypothetical protein